MDTLKSLLAKFVAGIGSIVGGAINLLETEPVAVVGFITVALDTAVAFGVNIDPAQKTALLALISAAGILFARTKVTPTAAPVIEQGTPITVVTPEGQPNTTIVA